MVGQLGFGFSHRFSLEIDPVGVMDETVEDGVGQGGITDDRVPLIDRLLTGHDGGPDVVAVLQDFE